MIIIIIYTLLILVLGFVAGVEFLLFTQRSEGSVKFTDLQVKIPRKGSCVHEPSKWKQGKDAGYQRRWCTKCNSAEDRKITQRN